MSVEKYSDIDTQAVIDIPLLYTAENELALANYDCDKVDLKSEPTRHPESGWLRNPGVAEVRRHVNDQVDAGQDKLAPPDILRIARAPFTLLHNFQSGQIAALERQLTFPRLIAIGNNNLLCHNKAAESVESV